MKLIVFNVENLFILADAPNRARLRDIIEQNRDVEWANLSSSLTPNKSLAQVKALAREIFAMNPDILMLCEVGGLESLENFSRFFLGDTYAPYLIEGNSERGIDVGYLVKRSLPFKYELVSHKHRAIDFLYPHEKLSKETGYAGEKLDKTASHRFSRDVLELRAYSTKVPETTEQISTSLPTQRPALVFLLVHLKSQLDKDRIDPLGRDRRKAELEKLIKIYQEIESDYGASTPVIIAGDFNGIASGSEAAPEFEALAQQTQLKDVLEIAGVPTEDRFTHMQINPFNSRSVNKQFDYIFVSPAAQLGVIKTETFVYRFKDEFGMKIDTPRTLAAKRLLPSDHYPVITELDLQKLRNR